MRFAAVATIATGLLAGAASAFPHFKAPPAPVCISNTTVYEIVDAYLALITNFTADVANALLNDDFFVESDSINELTAGAIPLGVVVYPTKEAFVSTYGTNPSLPLEILGLWYNCDTITYRWRTTELPVEVTGITLFEVSPTANNTYGWGFDAEYIEFNSGAWLEVLGLYTPPPASK